MKDQNSHGQAHANNVLPIGTRRIRKRERSMIRSGYRSRLASYVHGDLKDIALGKLGKFMRSMEMNDQIEEFLDGYERIDPAMIKMMKLIRIYRGVNKEFMKPHLSKRSTFELDRRSSLALDAELEAKEVVNNG